MLPRRPWYQARAALSRRLQREQRPRQPLLAEQRSALLPLVADDIRFLEEVTDSSYADWADGGRPATRRPLQPRGKIGTAHSSIDRPLGR